MPANGGGCVPESWVRGLYRTVSKPPQGPLGSPGLLSPASSAPSGIRGARAGVPRGGSLMYASSDPTLQFFSTLCPWP